MKSSSLVASVIWLLLFASPAYANFYEQALEKFHQGEYQASYIYLKNALDKDPKNLPAKLLMAKIMLQKGYYNEAIREYQESLSLNADMNLLISDYAAALIFAKEYQQVLNLADGIKLNTFSRLDWLLHKATAYQRLGQINRARESYQFAHDLEPSDQRASNGWASLELKQGNTARAFQLIQRSLQIAPNSYKTLHLLGKYYLQTERLEQAISTLNQALALYPDDPIIRRTLVSALIQNNSVKEARELVDKVAKASPDDPFILLLSSWIMAMNQEQEESMLLIEELSQKVSLLTDDELSEKPQMLYVVAVSSFMQGLNDKARKELIRYLKVEKDDMSAVSLLSDVYLKMDDKALAIDLLERYYSQVIADVKLGVKLADIYLDTRKKFEARELLERLNRSFPDNLDVMLRLVSVYNQQGKLEQSRELLASASTSDDGDNRIDLAKGMVYMQSKDFNSALQIAELLLAEAPSSPDYINFKAAVLLKLERADEAVKALEQLTLITPDFYEAKFNLATGYKALNRSEEALVILQDLHDKNPDDLNVQINIAQIHFLNGFPQKAEPLLERQMGSSGTRLGKELLYEVYVSQSKWQDAYRVMKSLNESYSFQPKYLFSLAKLQLQMGDFNSAQKTLGVLYGLANDDARLIFEIAQLQRRSGDYEASEKSLLRILNDLPNNLRVQLELSRVYLGQNRPEKAKEVVRNLSYKAKQDPNTIALRADIELLEGKKKSATDLYWRAVQKNTSFNMAILKLYQLAKEGYQTDRFTQFLVKVAQERDNDLFYTKLLADHYLNLGKRDLALEQYRKVLSSPVAQGDASVHNNIANILIKSDSNEALKHIKSAHELDNSSPNIVDTYGWVLFHLGRYDEALNMLRSAFAMDSSNKEVRYHIASVLHALNRNREAKEELEAALQGTENASWYSNAAALKEIL